MNDIDTKEITDAVVSGLRIDMQTALKNYLVYLRDVPAEIYSKVDRMVQFEVSKRMNERDEKIWKLQKEIEMLEQEISKLKGNR